MAFDFGPLLSGAQSQSQDPAAYARQHGYQVTGQEALGSFMGYPTRTPLGAFSGAGSSPRLGQQDLLRSLQTDMNTQQGAMDRQWGRNNQQIQGFDRFLGGMRGSMMGEANSEGSYLDQLAGRAEGMGQQQYGEVQGRVNQNDQQVNQGVDRALGGLTQIQGKMDQYAQDVNKGYNLMDQAVAGFQKSISEYKNTAPQDAAVVASAIRRNAQSQMDEIRAQDGTLPPQQIAAMEQQVKDQTNAQVYQNIVPLFSRFNEVKVQLGQALAQLQTTGAAMRLQGAQIKQGYAGLSLDAEKTKLGAEEFRAAAHQKGTEELLAAQEGQRQVTAMANSLRTMTVQLKSAALLASTQLEMQGRQAMAQMVANNPEGHVSTFQALLAMYTTQQNQSGFGGGSAHSSGNRQGGAGASTWGMGGNVGIGGQSSIQGSGRGGGRDSSSGRRMPQDQSQMGPPGQSDPGRQGDFPDFGGNQQGYA